MKPSFPRLPLVAAIFALTLPPAIHSFAQTTATTDPVGFITLNVAGTEGANGVAVSYKGLGLTRPVEYQGSAETVGSNTLVDDQASWADNQFNGANGAYYIEIASGPGAGTTYDIATTSAANKRITLEQNLATGIASGVTFKIRKHWTIGSVFGSANEGGLQAGNATTADQILIYNGTGYDIYFYQTNPVFGTGWRNAANPSADASGTRIYPEDGLLIKRRQTNPVNIVLTGAVKTGQTSVPIPPGTSFVGNVYAAPLTLNSSQLFTNDPNTGVKSGSSETADQVLLWNGTGYEVYFHQTNPVFGNGWRNAANPGQDAGSTPIPVGSSFMIKRKGTTGFDWKIPQHPSTL